MSSLGFTSKEQRNLGLLVHLMTSNPKILYAPAGSEADHVILKVCGRRVWDRSCAFLPSRSTSPAKAGVRALQAGLYVGLLGVKLNLMKSRCWCAWCPRLRVGVQWHLVAFPLGTPESFCRDGLLWLECSPSLAMLAEPGWLSSETPLPLHSSGRNEQVRGPLEPGVGSVGLV